MQKYFSTHHVVFIFANSKKQKNKETFEMVECMQGSQVTKPCT